MKKCSKCNKTMDENNFRIRKDTGDLNAKCIDCIKLYKRYYYQKNKEYIVSKSVKRTAKIRKETRLWLNDLKNAPCKDCGKKYPPYIMDFYHIEQKENDINFYIRYGCSKSKLINEIKKCEIICANCHRERTYKRGQY